MLDGDFTTCRSFDGTRLAWAEWGEGPEILLANGIACTDTYWTFLAPALVRRGYRVIFWDYRGHGRSGSPANPNEIFLPSFARDLWVVADAAGAEHPFLIGHSMGVQTILEAYRLDPGRTAGLAAAAGPFEHPISTLYGATFGHYLFPVVELAVEPAPWLTRALWRAAFAQLGLSYLVGRASQAIGAKAPRELMDEYFRHLGRLDPIMLVRMFRSMQHHSARDLLPRIKVPTLIVAGSRDVFTPPRLAEEMARLIPDTELVVLPGAGHTLPIDEPDALHEHLDDFLRRRVFTQRVAATLPACDPTPSSSTASASGGSESKVTPSATTPSGEETPS